MEPEEEHIERHQQLHTMLNELVADFIDKTGKLPGETLLSELMRWSYIQTKNPDIGRTPVNIML